MYFNIRLLSILGILFLSECAGQNRLNHLSENLSIFFKRNEQNSWGLSIKKRNGIIAFNKDPINIEIYENGDIKEIEAGYDSFSEENNAFIAKGKVRYKNVLFNVADHWRMDSSGQLSADRNVTVNGTLDGGFMSGIILTLDKSVKRDSVLIFAPGMIYGTTENLPEWAIGGAKCEDFIHIREDRLAAPLLGMYFKDGSSISVLNSKPDARTTKEDSRHPRKTLLIDDKFYFGAVGADFDKQAPALGYWYPGSEGGISYRGAVPPAKTLVWTRRYHPVKDGFAQHYQVSFKFASNNKFDTYYTDAWRWAWSVLKPKVNYQDIDLVRKSIMNMLYSNIETHDTLTGIRNFISAKDSARGGSNSIFGFTGQAIQVASCMLQYANENNAPSFQKYRKEGEAIIKSFMNLKMSPPEGEGINFITNKPALALENSRPEQVYLRSFGDALKELLKAFKREKKLGIEHPEWLHWAKTFGDWLLTQQTQDGGFPRSWAPSTGEVVNSSPSSSYNAIPFLVLLTELTKDNSYAEAAEKAGEFCWNTTQSKGVFIGGTIDNPNVLDKEAGTLSLEAYLALFHCTSEEKWLERATVAANYAETWMYIWNVPMPSDESDSELNWKKGVSNIGLQLISTGHSGADDYMAFNVDEYADLYLSTKDAHYYQVAKILLHNTKAMIALPGRLYGLKGPGWQIEHWSMAPPRGSDFRGWLPWLATSQLNGIFGLEELNKELYQKMIKY